MDTNSNPLRLNLLYHISQVFNSSLDLNEVLNHVLDEVIKALKAERGFLMLKDESGEFIFRVARGLEKQNISEPAFQTSRSIIERVKRLGKAIVITDAQEDDRFNTQNSVLALRLRSILCVPLTHKETMIGIIYVDNRLLSGAFTKDDLNLLSAIAGSAAIAIENAQLYENLQHSKQILEIAYDSTLEGWAKALDLRDHETEGHTRRVSSLAVRLAKALGMEDLDLVSIYRGALLHDIGKIAIPDHILHKPGPLTPEERAIMEFHPVYARDMLAEIDFLQPALEIPYCHHERWDGTGYPLGLKGTQIPLAARIFSIVDVWDALISERPYRSSWPPENVIEYLREQAGRQFDPHIVSIFVNLVQFEPLFEYPVSKKG